MRKLSLRVFYRMKLILNHVNDSWDNYISLSGSRRKAKRLRKQILSENGRSVVNRGLKNEIKNYCREVFGDTSYWPWLALYTEMRGEFKQGWIPDDYYRFKLLPRMNPAKFTSFSDAKTIDHILFNGSIIPPLFFRCNGQYCNKDGAVVGKSEIQRQLADMNAEVIIKPDSGHGGQDITFKHSKELGLNNLPPDTDLLFQKVVRQHHELDRLYPNSINTFRVLSFLNDEGDVEIKFIKIRFGLGGARVDNSTSGGGWVFIGKDGNVEPIAHDEHGKEIGTRHPDTDTEYASLELPFIPEVISFCKKSHRSFPYTRIVGWDVFIDQKGVPKLIEWNADYPGFWPNEARYGPFFEGYLNDSS